MATAHGKRHCRSQGSWHLSSFRTLFIYLKVHDHTLKQVAKQGAVEAILEHENIKDAWQNLTAQVANEEAERQAALKLAAGGEQSEPEEEECVVVRKSPATFPLHSAGYWRAVGNATVRTYITLLPEPRTQEGVTQAVAQSSLKKITGNLGESCVLVTMDLDLLGETCGPNCQGNLRKQFQPQAGLLSKLLHGSMVARGSPKDNDAGEATQVVEGDVVAIHTGMERTKKEAKNLFKPSSAGKGSKVNSELKDTIITYTDDSLRSRKRRVKGSYPGCSHMLFASSSCISLSVPEKSYQHHTGNCWSNVFSQVSALGPSDLWHTTRRACLFFFIVTFHP